MSEMKIKIPIDVKFINKCEEFFNHITKKAIDEKISPPELIIYLIWVEEFLRKYNDFRPYELARARYQCDRLIDEYKEEFEADSC